MKPHNIELQLEFGLLNGDTTQRIDNFVVELKIHDPDLIKASEILLEIPSTENLVTFAKLLYDNPEMNSTKSMDKGRCYFDLWNALSDYAYNRLGWHDAQASISKISINKKTVAISDDDIEYTLDQDLCLQLVRDEQYMYIRG